MFISFVVAFACCLACLQWVSSRLGVAAKTIDWKLSDPDSEFHFGEESAKYVIYRLIGNDMPPLQMVSRFLQTFTFTACCNSQVLVRLASCDGTPSMPFRMKLTCLVGAVFCIDPAARSRISMFLGVHERWILNRIWNETELGLLYTTLLRNGVNRRDILVRCFDLGM
jgi:hypothetical protein